MSTKTAIGWTDHTFNPWWGCSRVSPGCDNCYAATFAKRTGNDLWATGEHRFFGDKHWAEPLKWEREAAETGVRHLVFCASMADVFELDADLTRERSHLFDLIDITPHLTWQLLTKRPENVLRLAPDRWLRDWPSHAWLGTTVEDQTRANIRIPRLLAVQGVAVRFLSCEPLLGPLDLSQWLHLEWMDALRPPDAPPTFRTEDGEGGWGAEMFAYLQGRTPEIGWIIVGGESGAGHRPLDIRYARDVVQQCCAAEIPVFFKQIGGRFPKSGGDLLDGAEYKQFPAVAS